MIKMLQYKMYPAGELRCPMTALVFDMLVDIGYDLQVKVTDLEISYKSKKKLHLSLYSYTIKTFC